MSIQTARPHAGSDRQSLYDEITTKIIGQLEAGCVPWVQPWGTAAAKAPLAMPKNAATGRCYSGINVLILWGSIVEHDFPVQSWVTFRQALGLGGNVRRGEHGTTVVYADRFTPDDEKRRAQETGEKAQSIPFLKRFTVFNVAQCDGLPDDFITAAPPAEPALIEPKVEALIKAMGIDFRIGGDRAFYMPPPLDYIQVPPPQAFFDPINFTRTVLHEIGTTSTVLLGKKLCRLTRARDSLPTQRQTCNRAWTSLLLASCRCTPESRRTRRNAQVVSPGPCVTSIAGPHGCA
jgi:antirestriction protein ArdC